MLARDSYKSEIRLSMSYTHGVRTASVLTEGFTLQFAPSSPTTPQFVVFDSLLTCC